MPKCFSQELSLSASDVKSTFSRKTLIKGPTISNVKLSEVDVLKFEFSIDVSEVELTDVDDVSALLLDEWRCGTLVRAKSSEILSTTKSLK